MARSRTLLATVACAVLTLSMVSAGRAETPSTAEGPASVHAKERALALYERGSSAFAEGRYRDAIELLPAPPSRTTSAWRMQRSVTRQTRCAGPASTCGAPPRPRTGARWKRASPATRKP
jgi:hypothetical protein